MRHGRTRRANRRHHKPMHSGNKGHGVDAKIRAAKQDAGKSGSNRGNHG